MADAHIDQLIDQRSLAGPRVQRTSRGRTAPRWLVAAIGWMDASIRRAEGIVEFSDRPDCVLRIAVRHTDAPVRLRDAEVPAGAKFLDLHFFNDHLLRDDTRGLRWGARFRRRLTASLGELAEALERDPQLADVRAVRGRLASPLGRRRAELARFAERFGFEPLPECHPHWNGALHDLAENLWLLILGLAFGTQSHEHRALLRWRGDLWISRRRLIERFRRPRAADDGASDGGEGQGEGRRARAR